MNQVEIDILDTLSLADSDRDEIIKLSYYSDDEVDEALNSLIKNDYIDIYRRYKYEQQINFYHITSKGYKCIESEYLLEEG